MKSVYGPKYPSIVVAKISVATAMIPVLLWAYATGPERRHTGAPGDETCVACHIGNPLNSPGGSVSIQFPSGLTYTPGQKQSWTVTVASNTALVYGFQATARLASDERNGQAGTFHSIDASTFVLCDSGATRTSTTCPSHASVEFIEHSEPRPSGVWTIEWTPPAADVGDIRIYIAGNAANGNRQQTGDRIYTANYTLKPATGGGEDRPVISQGGVVDSWLALPGVAANSWTSIYGQNLAANTLTWESAIEGNTLPTTLDGVSVSIDNKPATVYFVSPGLINVLTPADIGVGDLPVVVRNARGESASFAVRGEAFKPTFYVFPQTPDNGKVYVTGVSLDGAYVGKVGTDPRVTRAARPGEIIQLYITGLGATEPAVPANQVVTGAPAVVNTVRVRLGDTVATVVNGNGNLVFAGLYLLNVTIPETIAPGEYPLVAEIGGLSSSSTVNLAVAP